MLSVPYSVVVSTYGGVCLWEVSSSGGSTVFYLSLPLSIFPLPHLFASRLVTNSLLWVWWRALQTIPSTWLNCLLARRLCCLLYQAPSHQAAQRFVVALSEHCSDQHDMEQLQLLSVVDLGGGGGGSMGSVEPPFLPQIHPESPGNGVSDLPDFKIFWGSMPPDPTSLSCLRCPQFQTPLHEIPDPPQLLSRGWSRGLGGGGLTL